MEYKRPKGFMGSIPRNWIDKRMPSCPFCGTDRPEWAIAMEMRLSLNRFHFRCARCHGVLSIPVVSVSNTGGIAGMMIAKNASKDLMVESTGSSRSQLMKGREYSIGALCAAVPRYSAKESDSVAPQSLETYTCPNCNGKVTADDKECPHCHAEFEEL